MKTASVRGANCVELFCKISCSLLQIFTNSEGSILTEFGRSNREESLKETFSVQIIIGLMKIFFFSIVERIFLTASVAKEFLFEFKKKKEVCYGLTCDAPTEFVV